MKVENLKEIDLEEYRRFVGEEVNEIREIARDLKGLKVVHVNATAFGGGVAELLSALVPLMRSVGLKVSWEVMEAPPEFFNVTKKLHNALQGGDVEITKEEWDLYTKVNGENAKKLELDADVLVIHDPQPAAIPLFLKKGGRLVWRCHIDLSNPNEEVWERFKEYIEPYEKMLFHMREYFPKEFEDRAVQFPPSIDPLSEKNREMSEVEIKEILKRLSIPDKPALTVVARFDPWKDLFSAVDVYRMVKSEVDVQLLVVSAMAHDDPEGWIFYERVLRYAGTDEDIRFLTNLTGVGAKQVNAIQRFSKIGLHTATREGFGLVISEMMWKGNPVVARPAGGVKLQIDDGVNGVLRWKKVDLAGEIVRLLEDEDRRKEMGRKAKEKVRKNFLVTSHLRRYLEIFREISS